MSQMKIDENQLDIGIAIRNQVQAAARKDKEYCFDKPFWLFLKHMSFLSSQSYGPRIQNRICKELLWAKIHASEDKGDAFSLEQGHCEIKVSFITQTNDCLNLVQIRLWQNVGYLGAWFDVVNKTYSVYILTHEQMVKETEIMASSAHGTKKTNIDNKNIELRLSLEVDPADVHFKRWESTYKSTVLDFLLKP